MSTKNSKGRKSAARRRQLTRKGLCSRPLCGHKAEPKRTLCPAHAQENRDKINAFRAERKAAGLCWRCPSPARPGGLLCEAHRRNVTQAEALTTDHERRYARTLQLQEARRERGLCLRCETPVLPGLTTCQRHSKRSLAPMNPTLLHEAHTHHDHSRRGPRAA